MSDLMYQRRTNRDGTRNVYCRRCHRFVGATSGMTNFGSVSDCAICLAADEGIVLPEEVYDSLQSMRTPDALVVPQFTVAIAKKEEEARRTDPLDQGDIENVSSLRHWLKAATIKVVETVTQRVKKGSGAQKLANDKKQKRIFDRSIEELIDDQDK